MFKLPWNEETIPHVMLEINHACNIKCETCYKKFSGTSKSLLDIQKELDYITSKRRIQTVSIGGGEPTLHPQLFAIIRDIKERGLKVVLVTNGFKLNEHLLQEVKEAGLDMVMLHIDSLQYRPDLPKKPSFEDVQDLRSQIIERVNGVGLDVGLSFMVNRKNIDELVPVMKYVISKPEVSFLLVTHSGDVSRLLELANLASKDKIAARKAISEEESLKERTSNTEVVSILKETFGIEPFGYLPSEKVDGKVVNKMQWMNYFVPVTYEKGTFKEYKIRTGLFDKYLYKLYRILTGKYMFYVRQDESRTSAQVLFNGIFSLRLRQLSGFVDSVLIKKAKIRGKWFAFDNGHLITDEGVMACMTHCPNPTVRNRTIVPVCLADHME